MMQWDGHLREREDGAGHWEHRGDLLKTKWNGQERPGTNWPGLLRTGMAGEVLLAPYSSEGVKDDDDIGIKS